MMINIFYDILTMEMKYILKDKWTVSFMETENIAKIALLTIGYF